MSELLSHRLQFMMQCGHPAGSDQYEGNRLIFLSFINFTAAEGHSSISRLPPKHSWNSKTTIATIGVVSNPQA
jgi:hypothetical protein